MSNTLKAIARFQRGTSTYTCRTCGRLTRPTGDGEGVGVRLCEACYILAGEENSVSDTGTTYDTPEIVLTYIKEVADKGGDASCWDALKRVCEDLIAVKAVAVEPKRLVLSAPQAIEVRNAMCAINHIGGRLHIRIPRLSDGRHTHVQEGPDGSVVVYVGDMIGNFNSRDGYERYTGQAEFRTAYKVE